jgi:DNA processing protein
LNAAREIAWHQINAGRTIVSGGAKGIDAVGHMVSLESGVPTIAVLAQSPNRPYPPEHRGMCAEIAHRGVVVSEVPPGIHHGGKGFLARNRLIAALATLTIVVEAPLRSGAISTAAHAAHLEREVMAVLYEEGEKHSGFTQVGVGKTGTMGLPGDNRGAERVIEQWAGQTILWPQK